MLPQEGKKPKHDGQDGDVNADNENNDTSGARLCGVGGGAFHAVWTAMELWPIVTGVAAWGDLSPDLQSTLVSFVGRRLGFSTLSVAYGVAVHRQQCLTLAWQWILLPVLGLGMTPFAMTLMVLLYWRIRELRKHPELFNA